MAAPHAPVPSGDDDDDRLDSWKQIASYLDRGERTVRRWELTEGLPVHRHVHQQRGTVWASRRELDEWSARRNVAAAVQPASTGSRRNWLLRAAGLTAAVAVVVAIVYRSPPSVPVVSPLTTYLGTESQPSLSPDGKRVAYFRGHLKAGRGEIQVRTVDGDDPAPLVQSANLVYDPAWSPDGASIAYLERLSTGTLLKVVPANGGETRMVADLGPVRLYMNSRHVSWMPDGRSIAVPASVDGQGSGIFLISVDGRERRLVSPPGDLREFAPAVSPDGRSIAYAHAALLGHGEGAELRRIRLSPDGRASAAETLYSSRGELNGFAWAPHGKELLACYADVFAPTALNLELVRIAVHPGATPQPTGVKPCFTLAVSRTGAIAFDRLQNDVGLFSQAIGGSAPPEPLFPSNRFQGYPDFSPDGRFIAFVSGRRDRAEIWVGEWKSRSLRPLVTLGRSVNGGPRWSPGGREILFAGANADEPSQVYTVPANGGPVRKVTSSPTPANNPSWSLDGGSIFYNVVNDSTVEIWKIARDGGRPERLLHDGGWFPMETATGSVVFKSGLPEMVREWRPGGPVRTIHQLDTFLPSFRAAPAGVYLAVPDSARRQTNFLLIPANGGPPRNLAALGQFGVHGLSVSPDGGTLIYGGASAEREADVFLIRNYPWD